VQHFGKNGLIMPSIIGGHARHYVIIIIQELS